MSDAFLTLEGTLDQVWMRLGRGVADRKSPARHPALATVGAGGEARIVVLRGADRALGTLRMHTDLRSEKVAELQAEPRATLLIWDQPAHLQIRLRVHVTILTGEPAAAEWARVPASARGVYGSAPAPGLAIATPEDATPGPDPAAFAVLAARVTQIETLHLGLDRHRRALFTDNAATWLAP